MRRHVSRRADGRALLGLDCEWAGEAQKRISILQLATESHCLVYSLREEGELPELLREVLVDASAAIKVGKALTDDWKLLSPQLGTVSEATDRLTAMEALGWYELTDFLPLSSENAPMDAISRTYLRRSYKLKGTVDHMLWNSWPLSREQVNYAASDVCIIVDVLRATVEHERSHAAAMSSTNLL